MAFNISSLAITLALAVLCVCLSVPAGRIGGRPLVALLVLSAAVWVLGAALSLPWYPLTSIVDVVFAVSLGLAAGRLVPARFRPFLILLIILSVLDVLQVGLSAGSHAAAQDSGLSAGQLYSTVVVKLPIGNYRLGPFDLAIAAAIGTHWLRRGAGLKVPLAGVATAVILAYAVILAKPVTLPLMPFFLVGWLGSGIWYRQLEHQTA
jgi:uncharacterized protein (DUF58 family)